MLQCARSDDSKAHLASAGLTLVSETRDGPAYTVLREKVSAPRQKALASLSLMSYTAGSAVH